MAIALKQAKIAKKNGEWPFGATVVLNNKIVSRSRCREGKQKNIVAHAELQAVSNACKKLNKNNLSDCAIYCTNEPCIMCAAAIFQAKIPRIIIGASRKDLSHLLRNRKLSIDDLVKDSGFKIEIVRGILKKQVLELFKDIQKK